MDWAIAGQLQVEIDETKLLLTPFQMTVALAGAEVEVFGSALGSGGFSSWGIVRTDSQGRFTLYAHKPDSRRIRIRVRFRDDSLKVTAPTPASDWEEVYESPEKLPGPTVNTGALTFRNPGDAPGHSPTLHAYRRAVTWYLCKTIIARLEAQDPWFAFKDRVNVVYPARAVGGSYASGVDRHVYLNHVGKNDQWDVPTVIHEFMHMWDFDHNQGSSRWIGGSTHEFQEKPAIAFHEGLAKYAVEELLHEIWGFPKPEPRSRAGLWGKSGAPLTSLAMVEGSEYGVLYGLQLLTTPNIYRRTFGTPEGNPDYAGTLPQQSMKAVGICPAAPDLTFWDVLSVFKPNEDAGWPTAWEAKQTSGLLRFFDRASDILTAFDAETKELYLSLLDINSTVEPQDRCARAVVRPPRDGKCQGRT